MLARVPVWLVYLTNGGLYHWDSVLAEVWGVACLVAGPVLVFGGARAAGCALLGSLAGSVVGLGLVSSNIDSLPYGAVFGASVGAVVFGLAGLAWRPAAPLAGHLKTLALATAVVGALVVLGVHAAADHTCYGPWAYHRPTSDYWRTPHPGASCLQDFGLWAQALLAFDVAFLVLLSWVQGAQASHDEIAVEVAEATPQVTA
jgi:hypothetical protein